MTDELTVFVQDLERQEAAPRTVASYQLDLELFAKWFDQTNGEPFAAKAVTPTDLREYRGYLQNVERRQPATINRKLAALKSFFRWAQGTKRITELPTDSVKGVRSEPSPPRWLDKRQVDRLLRAVERHGTTRDLAVLQ